MAIAVNSPPLFYMATAVIATYGASRLQAWLAVRGLRFERYVPPAVRVGEKVAVQVTVWSERRLKRPLVAIEDALPQSMRPVDWELSLPVAPSYDQPIQTRYHFKPMRRGRYTWARLTVVGTDALGLASLSKTYTTEPVTITVFPAPIPVFVEIDPLKGWGATDLDSGRMQGAGLEPRGVREYVSGDPLRFIDWKSSARTNKMMVKEFETGSGVTLMLMLQRTSTTDAFSDKTSSFEAMCGHALFLASENLKRNVELLFPQMEDFARLGEHPESRQREIREALTDIQADSQLSISQEVLSLERSFRPGDTLVLFLIAQDPDLPDAISALHEKRAVCLIYNAGDFVEGSAAYKHSPASDLSYVARLEQAGAQVVMMPKVERIG